MSEEIRVGFRFKHWTGPRVYEVNKAEGNLLTITWEGGSTCYAATEAKRFLAERQWVPISGPSSPTKEAEPLTLRVPEGATLTIHAAAGGGGILSEAEICAATEKRNAAYQEEQAAAIKKRWLEQQANPHQYMAWGRVQAGGWQQRGWGRK